MPENLSSALEKEHREIDSGIEDYVDDPSDVSPLQDAMEALRRHIYLEEEFLFPPLRDAGLSMPIFVMVREHGELWDSMDEIDELIEDEAAPDAVTKACRRLLEQLDQHNSKEEPVIYPQADQGLSPEATAHLQSFLDTGRMPEGWTCERSGGAPSAGGLFGH